MSLTYERIPKFPKPGYKVNVHWRSIERTLEGYGDPRSGVVLDLNPDYQRAHVWTDSQRTSYIEYILKGGEESQTIFFNCPDWPNSTEGALFELVDGKQRLESVRKFLRSEVPVFEDQLFRDFSKEDQGIILYRHNLEFRIAAFHTRLDVLDWYLSINTGGTPHTPEELDRVRMLRSAELVKMAKATDSRPQNTNTSGEEVSSL